MAELNVKATSKTTLEKIQEDNIQDVTTDPPKVDSEEEKKIKAQVDKINKNVTL